MQKSCTWRLAILLGALLVAPASAQDPERLVGAGSLGGVDITKVGITNVSYLDFLATEGGDTVLGTGVFVGTRFPFSGSTARLAASLDNGQIPNGAKIVKICLYYFDDNLSESLQLFYRLNFVDANSGANPVAQNHAFLSSNTNGDNVICEEVDLPFLYWYDVNDDGVADMVNHSLILRFGEDMDVTDGSLEVRNVRLLWRRRVSPAPATPTFDDVPANHLFYRGIEALAASGITAGCDADSYCPGAPLTRGQMAVFLAKALGLHWPAYVATP